MKVSVFFVCFFFSDLFIHYGGAGPSLAHTSFVWLWQRGPFTAARRLLAVLASLAAGRGSGVCGPRHLGTGSQELQLPASVAPRLVGFSPTTDRTHVPCIVRQTLNQRLATLEAIQMVHIMVYFFSISFPVLRYFHF